MTLAPEWLDRMAPRCWHAVSGDRPDLGLEPTAPGTRYLSDGDPGRDPELNPPHSLTERLRRALGREPLSRWHGALGFPAITEAWNSAVYASRYGVSGSMVVFGGGHNDYFGSDVHAFDLASRQWRRISTGYVSGGEQAYGAAARYPDSVYPDGSPLPPHTYDYVQYDPAGNDFLLCKGQTRLGPNVEAIAIPHLFNFDTLAWRRGPRHPTAILNSGGWSSWDASRRRLWMHSGDAGGGDAFISYSPEGDNGDGTYGRWGRHFPNKLRGVADHNAMQFEPRHDLLIVSVHASDAVYAIDPSNPEHAAVPLASTGEKPALQPYAALQFAPNSACLVYFSPQDGGTVFSITAPRVDPLDAAWRWRGIAVPPRSLNPIAHAARHTRFGVNLMHCFGRFRVASFGAIDVAILVRHVDSPVYAMRLN